jgi:hypothetical protein
MLLWEYYWQFDRTKLRKKSVTTPKVDLLLIEKWIALNPKTFLNALHGASKRVYSGSWGRSPIGSAFLERQGSLINAIARLHHAIVITGHHGFDQRLCLILPTQVEYWKSTERAPKENRKSTERVPKEYRKSTERVLKDYWKSNDRVSYNSWKIGRYHPFVPVYFFLQSAYFTKDIPRLSGSMIWIDSWLLCLA